MKLSPRLPVTYISSLILALFLNTILSENPTVVIEKLNFLEKVVSPPHKLIEYFLDFFLKDVKFGINA